MRFDYYDIICIVSIVQLLLFSVFLLSYKKGRKRSNSILALFLLSQAVVVFDLLCFHILDSEIALSPHLFYVGYPFRFLWAPALYLYTRSLTSLDFRFKRVHWHHFYPHYHHYTILAIAFESGFNSKSSFNLVFKKYANMTPSQYRKNNLNAT